MSVVANILAEVIMSFSQMMRATIVKPRWIIYRFGNHWQPKKKMLNR